MSKSQLPNVTAIPKTEKPQITATTGEVKIEIVAVTVPYVVAGESEGYQSRRCDLGALSAEQARKLNAIRRGYDYSGTTRADGGSVKTLADAVKALIDSVEI